MLFLQQRTQRTIIVVINRRIRMRADVADDYVDNAEFCCREFGELSRPIGAMQVKSSAPNATNRSKMRFNSALRGIDSQHFGTMFC